MRNWIALAFVLVACGKGDSKPAPQPTAAPAPQPPALPASAADQYQLPAAPNRAALPAKPAAYVFVTRTGEMRIGPDPAFGDAIRAADAEALQALIPAPGQRATAAPTPAPPAVDAGLDAAGDDGFGYGPAGFGPGGGPGGVLPVISRAVAFAGQTPPADARFVLVADTAVPFGVVVGVLQAIGEPTAVAVDGGNGSAAALSVAIDARSQPIYGGGVELEEDKPWSELVTALDTAAVAAPGKPIGVTVLFGRGLGMAGVSGFGVSSGGLQVRPGGPDVRIGQPLSVGDLEKAIIRRYIKRNLSKLTYCYEKQLLVDDQLQGTVTTSFVITPRGAVTNASATGVSPEVSRCVAAVIKRIEFPKPGDGAPVQVTYPIAFRPTGG